MVLSALRTGVTDNVRETVTLPSDSVTGKLLRVRAEDVAGALGALAVDGVPEVSLLTSLALVPLSEEETLETLSGQSVAVPLRVRVPVVGAVAGLALPARELRVTEEVICALVTPVPSVAVLTVTDRLPLLLVQVAGLGIAVPAGPGVRTSTLPTRHLVLAELRGSVVPNLTLLAEVAHGVVPAVDADAGLRVTRVRVSVTLTLPTVGEVPEARLALATLPAECWLHGVTETVPGVDVTELILGPEMVTVAGLAARPSEPECCRGTCVALPAHHQSLAVAVPVVLVTEDGGAARVVTVARPLPGSLQVRGQRSVNCQWRKCYLESQEGDGVKQPLTVLRHRVSSGLLGHHKVAPTPETLKQFSFSRGLLSTWEPPVHDILLSRGSQGGLLRLLLITSP